MIIIASLLFFVVEFLSIQENSSSLLKKPLKIHTKNSRQQKFRFEMLDIECIFDMMPTS